MKVSIFEDDKDLADAIKEVMDRHGFEVSNVYTLKTSDWKQSEIVLADYRNKIVLFEDVRKACEKEGIPILAISGADTEFRPQLLKPFTTEELQAAILDALVNAKNRKSNRPRGESGLFSKMKRIFGGS